MPSRWSCSKFRVTRCLWNKNAPLGYQRIFYFVGVPSHRITLLARRLGLGLHADVPSHRVALLSRRSILTRGRCRVPCQTYKKWQSWCLGLQVLCHLLARVSLAAYKTRCLAHSGLLMAPETKVGFEDNWLEAPKRSLDSLHEDRQRFISYRVNRLSFFNPILHWLHHLGAPNRCSSQALSWLK